MSSIFFWLFRENACTIGGQDNTSYWARDHNLISTRFIFIHLPSGLCQFTIHIHTTRDSCQYFAPYVLLNIIFTWGGSKYRISLLNWYLNTDHISERNTILWIPKVVSCSVVNQFDIQIQLKPGVKLEALVAKLNLFFKRYILIQFH